MTLPSHLPTISVVMSVYNGSPYLREAIESVLAQTYSDFEFIIIDDGSTDASAEIIRSYADSRIRFIQQPNAGLPSALNTAIHASCTGLIARMDCDDICLPERLQTEFEYMNEHPDIVLIGSAANYMDVDGNHIGKVVMPVDEYQIRKSFPESPFIHPTVMFKKEAFERAGGYPEHLRWGGEDTVLFGRLARHGRLANLEQPLIRYRIVPGSQSRKSADYRQLMNHIVAEEIKGNNIDAESLKRLSEGAGKLDKDTGLFQYHLQIAKLCLWAGGNSKLARRHCMQALALFMKPSAMMLCLITLLPNAWVKQLYFFWKKR